MATCLVCQPPEDMPDSEILRHLRLMHPAVYDPQRDAPERWPDGGYVVTDATVEGPDDIGWELPG